MVTETTYEHDLAGNVIRTVSVSEPEWTDTDRGLLLALLAERAETCDRCGHPISVCRDPKTAGSWQVIEEICQPTRVAQAVHEDLTKANRRGVVLKTRRG